MNKHLTRAISLLAWFAATVLSVLVCLVVLWIVQPDAKLDPAVETFTTIKSPPPAGGNAYFAVYGLLAAPELDPHQVGQRIIAEHDRRLAAERSLKNFDMTPFLGGERALKWEADKFKACDYRKTDCVKDLIDRNEYFRRAYEDNAFLVQRYRRLRDDPVYANAMLRVHVESPVPYWQPLIHISQLHEARILYLMENPRTRNEAIDELLQDAALWRKILESNDWLLTQVVATIPYKRKLMIASHALNTYPELASSQAMKRITAPLDHRRVNIAESMRNEARSLLSSLDSIGDVIDGENSNVWIKFRNAAGRAVIAVGGLKPNDLANKTHAGFSYLVDFVQKTPREVDTLQMRVPEEMCERFGGRLRSLVYNPFAGVYGCTELPNFIQYSQRLHDLIAYSRMLELQRQMLAADTPAAKVPRFLADASPDLFDPYLEKPFAWEPDTRTLSFKMRFKPDFVGGNLAITALK